MLKVKCEYNYNTRKYHLTTYDNDIYDGDVCSPFATSAEAFTYAERHNVKNFDFTVTSKNVSFYDIYFEMKRLAHLGNSFFQTACAEFEKMPKQQQKVLSEQLTASFALHDEAVASLSTELLLMQCCA